MAQMMQISINRWRILDALWLILLASYILAGTPDVPFHGDESTTIWMSRDYGYMFLDGELDRVRYAADLISETEQHLRLITGSLTKYAMGIFWAAHGYTTAEINEQWDWGADWNYNQQFGHAPDDTLLMLGRWPSALMLALGVSVIFAIGWHLDGRRVAYLASLYYALSPGLLLNGRRAMFEGGLVFFSLLTVFAGIEFLQKHQWGRAVFLGVVSALAISAKHPAVFTIIAVFAAISLEFLSGFLHQPQHRNLWLKAVSKLGLSGVIALLVFFVMHPVWWGDPFTRTGQVLDARSGILSGQVAAFGGYNSLTEQLEGSFRQILIARPQYYEVPGWENFIDEQINRYESSPWRGLSMGGSIGGAVILLLLLFVGIWHIAQQFSTPKIRLFALWTVAIMITSGLIIPIAWQRYYLMTYPVVALIAALGIVQVWDQLTRSQRKTSSASDN